MKEQFNKQQQAIIDSPCQRILVSASAGTGKTTVLIQRVLRLVSEGVPLESILMLTFNKAAAEEMRSRLFLKLKDAAGEYALRARIAMSAADITNFHSFAAKILRSYFFRAEVLPNFRIAEEGEAGFLAAAAADETLCEYYGKGDTVFDELSDIFSVGRRDDALKEKIRAIYAFACSTKDKMGWLSSATNVYSVAEKLLQEMDDDTDFSSYREEQSLPYAQKLLELTTRFSQIYALKKSRIGVLDFNDLEQGLYRLLQYPDIAEELRGQYQHVFVDEYQDISELQDAVIEAINPQNLFIVGDIKQSIYLFRLCAPDIFVQKRESFCSSGAEVFDLTQNYRSGTGILSFCDTLFSEIMTEDFGSVDYAAQSRFLSGSESYRGVSVDLETVAVKKTRATGCYSVKDDCEQAQANPVAERVLDYISRVLGSTVVIGGKTKTIMPADIAVLTRSRMDDYNAIAAALTRAGISVCCDRSGDLSSSPAVKMTLALLRCINNSSDDYALVGALTSRYFDFTRADLAKIRLYKRKKDRAAGVHGRARFFEAAREYAGMCDDEIARRLCNVFDFLQRMYEEASVNTVSGLLLKIYAETSILDRLSVFEDGLSLRQDLTDLREGIKSTAADVSLSQFLNYYSGTGLAGRSALLDEDSVKLMTIHSAKGLEFPVVIYASAGARFNISPSKGLLGVAAHRKHGLAVKAYDVAERCEMLSPAYRLIQRLNKKAQTEEEMRLLYVALTRAQCLLHIIGVNNQNLRAETAASALSVRGWLELAGLGQSMPPLELGLSRDEAALALDTANPPMIFSAPLPEHVQAIRQGLGREYSYNIKQPAKLSVSEAYRMQAEESGAAQAFEDAPRGTNPELAAQIGTAIHRCMEHADLSVQSIAETERMLDGLVSCGLISAEERQLVNAKKLFGCIAAVRELGGTIVREQGFLSVADGKKISNSFEGGIVVQGIVDLIVFFKEGISIVDYKTTRAGEDELVARYAPQLDAYADALEKILKLPVFKRYIYSFYLDRLIEVGAKAQ